MSTTEQVAEAASNMGEADKQCTDNHQFEWIETTPIMVGSWGTPLAPQARTYLLFCAKCGEVRKLP